VCVVCGGVWCCHGVLLRCVVLCCVVLCCVLISFCLYLTGLLCCRICVVEVVDGWMDGSVDGMEWIAPASDCIAIQGQRHTCVV